MNSRHFPSSTDLLSFRVNEFRQDSSGVQGSKDKVEEAWRTDAFRQKGGEKKRKKNSDDVAKMNNTEPVYQKRVLAFRKSHICSARLGLPSWT